MNTNEVKITVTSENDVRRGLNDSDRDLRRWQQQQVTQYRSFAVRMVSLSDTAGRDAGNKLGGGIADNTNGHLDRLTRDVNGRLRDMRGRFVSEGTKAGDVLGSNMGDGAHRGFLSRMRMMATRMASDLADAGSKAAQVFADGMAAAGPYVQGALVGLMVAAAPAVGAALTAAILLAVGGGVLAMGIKSAANSPEVKAAWASFGEQAKSTFEQFGEAFKGPVIRAADTLKGALKSITPDLKEMSETMAPLIDRLAPGLADMFKEMMPGLKDAVTASVPLFEKLAEHLPQIGESIGFFFEKVAEGGPGATKFFGYVLSWAENMIEVSGIVIGGLAQMFDVIDSGVRAVIKFATKMGRVFLDTLSVIAEGIVHTFGALPFGVGEAVKKGAKKFEEFKNKALGVFDAIEAAATFNISVSTGAALSKIAAVRSALNDVQYANAGQYIGRGGYAHGGIVGAATGGIHGGIRLVGENGPELVSLAPGSTVHPAGTTRNMLGGMGGGGQEPVVVHFKGDSVILEWLRRTVWVEGGGNVQLAFGKAGR